MKLKLGRLRLRSAYGCIYTAMGGHLVRINPSTRRHELLGTCPGLGAHLAFSGGYVYGFAGTNRVRFRLE